MSAVTLAASAQQLFSPFQLGSLRLDHRIVMAPLTRLRSEQPGDVPTPLMAEYYTQRTSAGGLIISEATAISPVARGYLGAPGIYTDQQVRGWRRITEAVHGKGGRIFQQLWHVGRTSHVDVTSGLAPVAPSVVPYDCTVYTKSGWLPVSPHRALDLAEIPALVADYRRAAERAKAAGFDGVEIHAANGYLLDQFLQDGSNRRQDAYGGTAENRARLLLEVTAAAASVWSGDRVGVRLAPSGSFNSMSDSNPAETFGYVTEQLNQFGLAYLHVIEPRIRGSNVLAEGQEPVAAMMLRRIFDGPIIAAGGFEPDTAQAIVANGHADLVAFGRYFIANPDLPERIRLGLPLSGYDRSTFYGGDSRGYTDYPLYHHPTNTRAA